ncbi:hypothetical protein OMK64_03440 [Cellulomonas fimi]|uniref:hypothetical protein n=1 Tax=Cellulomonas fimi TaxID=1708 RepID=UPI00234CD27D|nr:hypothetical protein [Cellulomonas fimi]MDC7120584.1 hypothetical protein [Cellulomonas fimi]
MPMSNPEPRPGDTFLATLDERGRITLDLPVPTDESITYSAEERIGDGPRLVYELTLPPGKAAVELTAPIVERQGGASAADAQYRERLYAAVGRITVAGGQVEASLKRSLILLSPERGAAFVDVDLEWFRLEAAIREAVDSAESVLGRRVVRLLDLAARNRLRERRNDAVHGAWWPFDGMAGRVSRWPRRSEGYITNVDLRALEEVGAKLERLVQALNDLVRERWPVVTLPRDDRPTGSFGV